MVFYIHSNQKILDGLRRQIGWYILTVAAVFTAGFLIFWEAWMPEYAWRWFIVGICTLGIAQRTVWVNLYENRRKSEEGLLPDLGAGNIASLFRGALIAALFGFLFLPSPEGKLSWLPGLLYTAAVLVDILDGALARLTNHVTRLGEILDMYFDGLGMLAATAIIVHYGKVPAWYLGIGLARYLFLFGIWMRAHLGKDIFPMPTSVRRRGMAAVQMGFVAVMLWPLFSPPGTQVMAYAFGIPLLIGFLWDWLYVSGVISPISIQRYASIKDFILCYMPAGLRLGVLLCSVTLLHLPGLNQIAPVGWIMLVLVIVGAAGRVASIGGLIILGVQQVAAPLLPSQMVLGILFSLILLLGTGIFSLWKPEELLIYKKIGEHPLRRLQRPLETPE
jgi:CDP-diacylglycerol---glycerol-3-phosphate 3-phosphatidyltransferase